MALWIVRHAQPLIEAGICYGALDIEADKFATQAAALALADVLPDSLEVEVSPLRRCLQLQAALKALRPDLVFTLEPRLAEMNFGVWEGVAWDAIDPQARSAWPDNFQRHSRRKRCKAMAKACAWLWGLDYFGFVATNRRDGTLSAQRLSRLTHITPMQNQPMVCVYQVFLWDAFEKFALNI
jgi:alpha-ribazole phosphatase